MKLHYYPETDSLYIELTDAPGTEAREIVEGLVADFDAAGNVVGLDTDHASRKLDLSKVETIVLPPVSTQQAALLIAMCSAIELRSKPFGQFNIPSSRNTRAKKAASRNGSTISPPSAIMSAKSRSPSVPSETASARRYPPRGSYPRHVDQTSGPVRSWLFGHFDQLDILFQEFIDEFIERNSPRLGARR